MKTLIRLTLFVASSILTVVAVTGCGSNNNGSSTSTSAYTYINGQCYATSTNTIVATSYCSGTSYNASLFSWNGSTCTNLQTGGAVNTAYCQSNPFTQQTGGCYDSIAQSYTSSVYCTASTSITNSGYTYQNGQCYSTTTGYPVATTYCTNSTSTVNGYTAQTCVGPNYYYLQGGYYATLVNCSVTYCRGQILYSIATKQPVVCQ